MMRIPFGGYCSGLEGGFAAQLSMICLDYAIRAKPLEYVLTEGNDTDPIDAVGV